MTSDIVWTFALASGAGAAGTLGGVAARLTSPARRQMDFITAFGAGALIGAIGLVLLPHAVENLPIWLLLVAFVLGGLLALSLSRVTSQGSSVLAAMLLDYVPEVIVLGALMTMDFMQAVILAIIIAAQNGPEGFSAYRDMTEAGLSPQAAILRLCLLPLIGVAAGAFGLWLCTLHDVMLGVILAGASGGILYLVLSSVIPESHHEGCGPWPSYGGVLGFGVALLGYAITA